MQNIYQFLRSNSSTNILLKISVVRILTIILCESKTYFYLQTKLLAGLVVERKQLK